MKTLGTAVREQNKPTIVNYEATLSARGSVQIPVKVRKLLNLQPNDKVVFRVTNQEITIKIEPKVSLDDLYGSVTPKEPITKDVDVMIREAKAEHRDARYKRIMK